MEHITTIDDGFAQTLVFGASAAFVCALICVAAALFVSRRWAIAAATLFSLVGVVVGVGAAHAQAGTLEQRVQAIQKAVFHEYGIAIGEDEAIQLHWPKEKPDRPGEYGATKLIVNGDLVTVALVWDGAKFQLAAKPSPDAPGKPLPPAAPAA